MTHSVMPFAVRETICIHILDSSSDQHVRLVRCLFISKLDIQVTSSKIAGKRWEAFPWKLRVMPAGVVAPRPLAMLSTHRKFGCFDSYHISCTKLLLHKRRFIVRTLYDNWLNGMVPLSLMHGRLDRQCRSKIIRVPTHSSALWSIGPVILEV
jgi:hypothetical protein